VGVLARTAAEVSATADEIQAAGGRAIPLVADVTSNGDVEAAVTSLEDRLGPLTLLVNNAVTCQDIGPLWDLDPERWWAEVAANLPGRQFFPRFASLKPEDFLPPERLVLAVVTLASGTADDLSGRYVHAVEDISAVAAQAKRIQDDDLPVLRVTGEP
jgi:NAD(P)-dependent dehydrogenase (short-subunit alcohol dehydrogenase family)